MQTIIRKAPLTEKEIEEKKKENRAKFIKKLKEDEKCFVKPLVKFKL